MSCKQDYNLTECSRKVFTLPNILTMIRIAIIPVMVWLFFINQLWWMAGLLVFSAITDVVDGIIARKFNLVTEVGKALDPIADKLTQCVVLLCLVFNFKQLIIPLIILAVKEIFTLITQIIIYSKRKIVVGADWYGKITTVFLYAMMFVHIVWVNIPQVVSIVLISISIAFMVSALVLYAIRNIRIIKSKDESK